MNAPIRIIFLLEVCYAFNLSCNNPQKSSEQTGDVQTTAIENSSGAITESDKKEHTETDNTKISFDSAPWYTKSRNEEIFNGLNTNLMAGVILDYVQKYHLDPQKSDVANLSASVELKYNQFVAYQRIESEFTMYDAELARVSFMNRVGGGEEEISQAEVEKQEKALKNEIDAIDAGLKKIKIYDRQIIKGKYSVLEVKNDSIRLKIEGQIIEIDALSYEAYGENGPNSENSFADEVTIDLAEAFNTVGRLYYFEMHDLEVVNNQSLKYLRNQFFARRGYIFKTDLMKEYFSSKSWYTPLYDDVSTLLTKHEKYNTELIKQFEDQVK